jgi:hypothetical protein
MPTLTPSPVPSPPPKIIVALTHLVNHPLNHLDALRLYGDTCLNSTISTLTHKHGFLFSRVSEPHKNQAGGLSHFTRYTLIADHKDKANQLINKHYSTNGSKG